MPLDPRTATELMADVLLAARRARRDHRHRADHERRVLLRDRPELAARIREIVWMGGSTERGNVTPYAEFNAWVDPEALDARRAAAASASRWSG